MSQYRNPGCRKGGTGEKCRQRGSPSIRGPAPSLRCGTPTTPLSDLEQVPLLLDTDLLLSVKSLHVTDMTGGGEARPNGRMARITCEARSPVGFRGAQRRLGWAGGKRQRCTARVQGSGEQSGSRERCQGTVGWQTSRPPEDWSVPPPPLATSHPLSCADSEGRRHHPPPHQPEPLDSEFEARPGLGQGAQPCRKHEAGLCRGPAGLTEPSCCPTDSH